MIRAFGEEPPLDEAAAWIAADEQGQGEDAVDATVAQLDALAEGLHVPPQASVFERVARVNHRLFTELGFVGDSEDYDAPENSCLDLVIARRKGLPILLSVLLIEVSRRAGHAVDGVGFPGHFIVEPRGADPRFFIDPFHQGQVLREIDLRARLEQLFQQKLPPGADLSRFTRRASSRMILIRMNNNLKVSHARRGNLLQALRAVERLIALAPELHAERRDRGLLLAQLGRHAEARGALQDYLEAAPDAEDAARVRALIHESEPE
ncbi:MAG: tetratricopeptide repeat protein [Alphaproteobacteria bacterium]|nr:tetratricopeptide repeat protein [Alphaproteobacteria bacterium]